MNRASKTGLLLFGALLIVLFAAIAIAQGITKPSVPSGDVAYVTNVPGDLGHISKQDFNRAMLQTAARSGEKTVPKPGTAQYKTVHDGALNDLLDQAWLTGEAAELGVTATPREVAAELKTVKSQQFKTAAEFTAYLKQAHFTKAEVLSRVKLQLLSQKIQSNITKSVTTVPDSDIQNYYDSSKSQFTTPEARDILLVVNKDKAKVDAAKAQLEKGSNTKQWAAVARKYSTDPSATTGGVKTGVTSGVIADPAGSAVFSASKGQIVGPIKNSDGYYLFKISKITPEDVQPLDTVKSQISQQLVQQAQQSKMNSFVTAYNSKWTSRTFCDEGYMTSRCENYKSDGRVDGADPACYKAGAGKKAMADKNPLICPASVFQTKPQAPGSSTALAPNGIQLPQHPIVAGGKTAPLSAASGLTSAAGGATGATTGSSASAQAAAAAAAQAQASGSATGQ